jgi:hypothetical protein
MKSTNIKKALALIVLCILLVVLDKVYTLVPNTVLSKTIVKK